MKITISGLAGTGTSTIAKELASRLKLNFKSSGHMFREKARVLGLSINELDTRAKTDAKYDNELDQTVQKIGIIEDDFVFDSRLAWYFIPDAFNILLTCDLSTRIQRIADRENKSFDQAKKETEEREEAIYDRYKKYYKIEKFNDEKNFSLVVDTTKRSVEETVKEVMDNLEKYSTETTLDNEKI